MTLPELAALVHKVRSKNAGPFWLTIDIFCGTPDAYTDVVARLSNGRIARVFNVPLQHIKRFDIPDLNVIKISLPRPTMQGAPQDRDIHGASWAALLAEITI